MTIEEFVKKDNYVDSYEKVCDWQEFSVYEIWAKSDEGACTGYPQFALDNGKIIRRATFPEIKKIMSAINK